MKLTLNNFEQLIDEKILKRGRNYFHKGYVTDVEEVEEDEYEIIVEGSDTYTVNLTLAGNIITYCDCDCPYEDGLVCKHIAASLFYLQEDKTKPVDLPLKQTPEKQKKKSISQQTEELLALLPHADLKVFVRDLFANDHKLRQLFIARYIHLSSPVSKELYVRKLKALVKVYEDKHGFIGYSETRRLANAISGLIEEVEKELQNGQLKSAMEVTFALVEEIAQLFYYVDDSNGEIGGCMCYLFEIFETLTTIELDDTLHDELFDHLTTLFEKKTLHDWDWHFETITLAIKLVRTPREKEKIRTLLTKIESSKTRDWDYEQARKLMLQLIRKMEGPEAAIQYMENNISNTVFRVELIEKAIQAKDYEKAETLAHEGIAKDKKDAPGLVDQWQGYLLSIYQETKDIENTIRLAHYFLLHSIGRSHPLEYYYNILKPLIPTNQWDDYLNNLIVEIKSEGRWYDYSRIFQLYVLEASWDKLLELLQQNISLDHITQAEPYLSAHYPDELATFYKEQILAYLEKNVSRSHYQSACRYIRRMMKLGAHSMVTELVKELKSKYPTRRAMIEELNNL